MTSTWSLGLRMIQRYWETKHNRRASLVKQHSSLEIAKSTEDLWTDILPVSADQVGAVSLVPHIQGSALQV